MIKKLVVKYKFLTLIMEKNIAHMNLNNFLRCMVVRILKNAD